MSLLDIFKKKKTPKKGKLSTSQVEKEKKKGKIPQKEKVPQREKKIIAKQNFDISNSQSTIAEKEEVKPKIPRSEKKTSGVAHRILYSPHITEKVTALAEQNKYIFKVGPRANKTEIKKTIEDIYGVEVKKVKIINIIPKKRRLGKQTGLKKGYKKAIVGIKEGQKIEILHR